MRVMALLPLLIVAGCGDGGDQANKAAAAAAPPTVLPAGQWELASEVTRFTQTDGGTPKINTPVGTRKTVSICVGGGAQLPAELFTEEGYGCTVGNYYARNGRLTVDLQCRVEGLNGVVPVSMSGTFTADSLEYTRNVRTALYTNGNVVIDSHVTGHRTGDCTPAPAAAANTQ